jgi:methylenetetrahydrofolate reductase (NADH)
MLNDILDDYSIEMTGKDAPSLNEARALLRPGTRVNVTYLGNEGPEMRRTAIRTAAGWGFTPVPHISSRRLASRHALEGFLGALREDGTAHDVFVVGGDPGQPQGPYSSSLDVIRTGLLEKYGVGSVSISGYPEGHPDISDRLLWSAITEKTREVTWRGIAGNVVTQFSFDADAVVAWIEQARDQGVTLPIRIGVPGPAGVRRLLTFAKRFGVASSATIARKYGLSLTNLLSTAGPDRFIRRLSDRLNETYGDVRLHFYTFGGLQETAAWIRRRLNHRVPALPGQTDLPDLR